MSRESKLAKNTGIYMIGRLSSKFLAFFMLPMYTFFLSQSDLGIFDIIYTSGTLALPIIIISIHHSVFRFTIEETDNQLRDMYISNGVFIVFLGILVLSIPYLVSSYLYNLGNNLLILMFVIFLILGFVWQQMARALQKNVVFAISGVLLTLMTFFTSVLFILVFNMRLDGLILSNALSSLSVFIYIEWKLKILKKLYPTYLNKDVLKKMLAYSLPLLPGDVSYWLMSFASRYIITFFLGYQANGVFSVVMKFPSLLIMINEVFILAWTESSILEYKSKDKDAFYTKTFNIFMRLQFAIFLILLPVLKYLMQFLVENSYDYAWIYIPFLLLGTLFLAFSNFYGAGYLGSKNTMGAFITILVASILNIVITLLLVQRIGIHAAGIGSCLSYLFLWIIRIIHTKKYFIIRLDYKILLIYSILVGLYIYGFYLNKLWIDALLFVCAIMVGYHTNKVIIGDMFCKIYQKLRPKVRTN